MGKTLEHIAKCSQMSNPKAGTGQGGDRCVEATAAMIDATYILGPKAKAGMEPEGLMYAFTEEWNQGRDVSALESGTRIDDFLKEYNISVNHVSGFFANVQSIIDRGHIAYTGVNDYRKLRLVGGGNPYQWNPATQPPAGHVLLIVGYDSGVIVHDPLRAAPDGQPAEYSVTSFEEAGWDEIAEVMGPRLDSAEQRTWVLKPGNTFPSLAAFFYGQDDPRLVKLLIDANPGINPAAMPIGATIQVPPMPADFVPAPLFETVQSWPAKLSTLSGIAEVHGITLETLLAFPENEQYRHNPDLIYAGNKVRVR